MKFKKVRLNAYTSRRKLYISITITYNLQELLEWIKKSCMSREQFGRSHTSSPSKIKLPKWTIKAKGLDRWQIYRYGSSVRELCSAWQHRLSFFLPVSTRFSPQGSKHIVSTLPNSYSKWMTLTSARMDLLMQLRRAVNNVEKSIQVTKTTSATWIGSRVESATSKPFLLQSLQRQPILLFYQWSTQDV